MQKVGKSRWISILFLLGFTGVFLTFYKQAPGSSFPAPHVLGLVVTPAEDNWHDGLTRSIRQAAVRRDMEVMTIEAERSQESQISALRALLVYQADAIVFSPVVENGWDNILTEAKQAGIPVIGVNKAVKPRKEGLEANYVGYDYYRRAKQAAIYLIEDMKDKQGLIVELCGTTGSTPTKEITRGFRETLSMAGLTVGYSVNGQYMRSHGEELIFGLVESGTDIAAIISHNDAMTLGAVDALKRAGLRPGEDVFIYSFGGGPEMQSLFNAGELNVLIRCDLKTIGSCVLDVEGQLTQGEQGPVSILAPSYVLRRQGDVNA